MNIAIVDDNNPDIEQLSSLLQDYASLNLTEVSIDRYNDPDGFIDSYAPFRYTAIFMDIYMNGKNGIDAAGRIRETDPDALIIFLTTSEDHMPSAFSLHAFDYVIKPAGKDRIFRLMDDITHRVTRDGKCFAFPDGKSEYRMRFSNIVGIRSNGHYLHITDKDMNEHKCRMNFRDAEEQLKEDGRFLLINRGTMVNMDYITDFGNGICVVGDKIHLPYNVKKRKTLEQTYRNYMFAKIRRNMH